MRIFLLGDCESIRPQLELRRQELLLTKKNHSVLNVLTLAPEGAERPFMDQVDAITHIAYMNYQVYAKYDLLNDPIMVAIAKKLDSLGMVGIDISNGFGQLDQLTPLRLWNMQQIKTYMQSNPSGHDATNAN
jgi:hypothetical protein